MFRTNTNSKIGEHLAHLIKANGFSDRQFGVAFLRLRDDHRMPGNDEIQKMANRICQMKKGSKAVQIEDLPIFSELLGVSIEEILSAGEFVTPSTSRITNYSIAHSNNPSEWKAYINREDKLILNPDEYNKTVIDYALETENYDFISFLMKNNYIWFASKIENGYGGRLSAGTNIKRREIGYMDSLDSYMKENEDLRYKVIALAIKNNDHNMLDTLHARESNLLYGRNSVLHGDLRNKKLPVTTNIKAMVDSISSSDENFIDYFFEKIKVPSISENTTNTFIFPYAGLLLKELIKKDNKKAQRYLQIAINHNKSVQQKLIKAVNNNIDLWMDYFDETNNSKFEEVRTNMKEEYTKNTWRDYFFYPQNGFVAFFDRQISRDSQRKNNSFITNVINVNYNAKVSEPKTQKLIEELNKSYNQFEKYFEKQK